MSLVVSFSFLLFWIARIDRYPIFFYHFGVGRIGYIYQVLRVLRATGTTGNLKIGEFGSIESLQLKIKNTRT